MFSKLFIYVIGLSLVTVLPVIAIFIWLYWNARSLKHIANPLMFSVQSILDPVVYMVTLSIVGFAFAIPAIFIAGVGLYKRMYIILNAITIAVASLILLWNIFTMLTGGALFAQNSGYFTFEKNMDLFSGIILGAIQGLTEFLPISSSGHLILAREVLGLQTEYGLSVDAVLHLATAFAILAYFWRDIVRLIFSFFAIIAGRIVDRSDRILLIALVLATLPAVAFGLLLEETMETVFRNAELVAYALLFGSFIFWLAEKYASQNEALTVKNGFVIGLFQSLALIPGMSRAGMAISGGLFLGLTRENATRFAFLLGFPLFLGSGIKKSIELSLNGALVEFGPSLVLSALTAFVIGLLAIHYLLKYLRSHTIHIFIWYRVALAVIILTSTHFF